ncbi:MAG: hypothetical protein Q8S00_00585 [Deltaproteobacteria bacterium]|nr:hypothetical protein [Deltaproteobacteria bacterium]
MSVPDPTHEALITEIASALRSVSAEHAPPGHETSGIGHAFLRLWMKERGHAFFFLFRKNVTVTNIQFAELLALVSCYTKNKRTGCRPTSLQFVSSNDFSATVQGIVDALPLSPVSSEPGSKRIAEHYAHLLQDTIVVDTFFGSCCIYLSPHLDLDLRAVCGLSGYVHSCGRNVFVRNITKAQRQHFFEALRHYLRRYPRGDKRIFFTVYAHEDFTEFDTEHRRDLADGLDDVKIHVDKFFMGGQHLVDVLRDLRKEFHGQVAIPDPGDFRDQHRRLRKAADIDQDRTMWLICDYGIDPRSCNRSEERYFICYDQLYDNKNPFHIFDENKPAWIEHTTIPHTLIGAMINVTMPHWTKPPVVIGDPFVGTGTTWLEASKYAEVVARTGDISKTAVRAACDNAEFFALDVEGVKRIATTLVDVAKKLENSSGPSQGRRRGGGVSREAKAESLAGKVREWATEEAVHLEDLAEQILTKEDDLLVRVLFYVALRSNKRHAPGLSRGAEEWSKAFAREATTLSRQMESLAEVRDRAQITSKSDGVLIESRGSYSRSVTIDPARVIALLATGERNASLRVADARNLAATAGDTNGYDVIVTDPPYGFNTDEAAEELAQLYADVLRAAINALKPDGHLVICLPERSSIGKQPSVFTHRSIVTHQVLALAEEAKREVLTPARSLPGPSPLFGPPFYWASERALRRSILHFRIRQRPVRD